MSDYYDEEEDFDSPLDGIFSGDDEDERLLEELEDWEFEDIDEVDADADVDSDSDNDTDDKVVD